MFYVGITLNENDRRLLIIFLIFLLVLFIILGLVGMGIRLLFKKQGKRVDSFLHDPVVYRVISSPEHLKKYGKKKNAQLFVREASPAILIGLALLAFYVVYSSITGEWAVNHFERFSTVFYAYDWNDESIYVTLWGMRLLNEWPPLIHAPYLEASYWASYAIVPLFLVFLVYYLVAAMAYLSRALTLRSRMRTVYEKTLEGYNFYDALKGDKEKALASEAAKAEIKQEEAAASSEQKS